MKIYTASAFGRYEDVRIFNDKVRALGHTITFDWTCTDEFGPEGHPVGPPTEEQKKRYALNDYFGASSCDTLVFLSDPKTVSGLVEVGIAMGRQAQILVVDKDRLERNCIFFHHPLVWLYDSADAALEHLATLRKEI